MPRPLRSTFPFGYWHITSRGVDGRLIFMGAEDRRVFLFLLNLVIRDFGWRCHAYCLMGNSYSRLNPMVPLFLVPTPGVGSRSDFSP